jgi:hypothetical protein
MLRTWLRALAVGALALSGPAFAADNYTVKDTTGATRTIRAKDTGGVLTPQSSPTLPDGTSLFTTASPGYVALQAGSSLTLGAGSAAIGSVTQGGTWSFGLSGPIPAGGNVIGGVTQSGTWSDRMQDGAGNPLTSRVAGSSRPLDVTIVDGAGNAVTSFGGGTGGTATTVTANQGTAGTAPWPVTWSGNLGVTVSNFPATQAISASGLPLPAGAATSALQSTIAANQNSTAAGTSATNAQAIQGVTNGVPITTATSAIGTISVARTTVGTTTALISAADPTNRRTVLNNGSVACEFGPAGFAYGAGFPLAPGNSFTFDNAGRNTAAIYGACAAAGGAFAVASF